MAGTRSDDALELSPAEDDVYVPDLLAQAGTPPAPPENLHAIDEFSLARLGASPFPAERASHLGGPQPRVYPAMPARLVTAEDRVVPGEEAPRSHESSPEQRLRDARRTADEERHVHVRSPWVTLAGVAGVAVLMIALLLLASGRA